MPWRAWVHEGPIEPRKSWWGPEVCPKCRRKGRFIGWRYSMIEAMGAYQDFYGLKPIGRHRLFADNLLSPLVERCATCNGEGLLDDPSTSNYRLCSDCRGTGRTLACSS